MATKKLTFDKKTVSKLNETDLQNINGGESPMPTLQLKCIGDAITKLFNCNGEIL